MNALKQEKQRPPLCAACGRRDRSQTPICARCTRRLEDLDPILGGGPAGLDRIWSSAPYDDPARSVVAALKFRHLLPVAELMADRISWLAPAHMLSGTIVPVPDARSERLTGAFDPAAAIAAALGDLLDSMPVSCLEIGKPPRRPRTSAATDTPPEIRATGPAPRSVLLVDDVLRSGANLTAAARALRAVGASRVIAITFART